MIGIYKFTNKINGHIYIGQSINIEKRKKDHYYSSYNKNANDYNQQFHQAIRKYGFDNFDFEIVAELTSEEYTKETLNSLEKFFIKYYDSYHGGYNATQGGQSTSENFLRKGELNGRALLKESDVIYIRECYNAHIPFREVYKEYEQIISKRGLQNVWWFNTWKDILPEYNTPENKYWHSHQAKANSPEVACNNKRAFTPEEVKLFRKEYEENNLSPKEIWQKYAPDKAWSTIYNIITRQTYQDIL